LKDAEVVDNFLIITFSHLQKKNYDAEVADNFSIIIFSHLKKTQVKYDGSS